MIEFLCAICAVIADTFFSEQAETLLAYAYFPKDDLGRSYEDQIESILPLLKPGSQIITIDQS